MADTQAIKDRVDIVQLVQEYLPLKKAGANWKAPCPFHHEKTPSFMVHPEKQIWHCFGCGKGGDIFSFVQEMEGLDFAETLKLLADRAGIKLENNFQNEVNKSQKNRIYEINAKAANFFNRMLLEMPASQAARDYLFVKRGLKKETVNEWQVGYIPDQWDLLTKYFLNKGIGIDDLIASGLTVKNEERKSSYDRFRGRIMFPIANVHGDVAGFTGRILFEKENSGGKYVNTPQTIVYDKSRILYGLNKAKTEIKVKDLAVIVEGQMDVIACHEAGMSNVVAASGTALTEEQIKLLKRYTSNLAMAFDADSAGENAAKRGIDLALSEGMNIRVIQIPNGAGKDADECIRKDSKVWFKAVDEAVGIMDWYFGRAARGADLNDPKIKQSVANSLIEEIIKIPFAVEREAWLKKLSDLLNIDTGVLREVAGKIKIKPSMRPAGSAQAPTVEISVAHSSKLNFLLDKFWALVVKSPAIYSSLHAFIKPEHFVDSPFAALYDFCEKQYNSNVPIGFSDAGVGLTNEKGESLIDLLYMQAEKDFADMDKESLKKEAELIIAEIDKASKKMRRDKLSNELNAAQATGDSAKENEILKQIMELR